jgi:hypothetical protein
MTASRTRRPAAGVVDQIKNSALTPIVNQADAGKRNDRSASWSASCERRGVRAGRASRERGDRRTHAIRRIRSNRSATPATATSGHRRGRRPPPPGDLLLESPVAREVVDNRRQLTASTRRTGLEPVSKRAADELIHDAGNVAVRAPPGSSARSTGGWPAGGPCWPRYGRADQPCRSPDCMSPRIPRVPAQCTCAADRPSAATCSAPGPASSPRSRGRDDR